MRQVAGPWVKRLAGSRTMWVLVLIIPLLVVLVAACSGVNDNGTQDAALLTQESRLTPPPPPPGGATPPAGTAAPEGSPTAAATGGAGATPSAAGTSSSGATPSSAAAETPGSGSTTPDPALVAAGQQLYTSKGCVGCHSVDGSPLVGPSWKGLYGSTVELADGTTVTADDAYISESILDPSAKTVKGFPAGIMPSFQGQVTDDDIKALIAYMQTLQ